MILTVIGRPSRERSAVAARLGARMNAVVVDGALELRWEHETTRGPDIHDVLAGRATPIEAVCEDESVSILPCGRPIAETTHTELVRGLKAVEREYGTVLVDCPSIGNCGVLSASRGVILVTTGRADVGSELFEEREAQTLAAVIAIALCSADETTAAIIKRLERAFQAPVTPIPGVPRSSVSRASDRLEARPVHRALRRLAESVHSSVRS